MYYLLLFGRYSICYIFRNCQIEYIVTIAFQSVHNSFMWESPFLTNKGYKYNDKLQCLVLLIKGVLSKEWKLLPKYIEDMQFSWPRLPLYIDNACCFVNDQIQMDATYSTPFHVKSMTGWHLGLRISTPKLEIPLICI